MHRDAAVKRRREIEVADRGGLADVADVEDVHPRAAVIEIEPVAVDDRRPVNLHAVFGLFTRGDVLPWCRPARNLHRLGRVLNVDDDEEFVLVTGQRGGSVDVAASWVAVAVCAAASGLPLAKFLRVDRVLDIPDQEPFVVRLRGVAAPPARYLFQPGDHDVVVEIHLDRPGVLRPGHELEHLRLGGIGDVHDGPSPVPQVAHVHVPAAAHLPDRHLESGSSVGLAVADDLEIRCCKSLRDVLGVRGLGRQDDGGGGDEETDQPLHGWTYLVSLKTSCALARTRGAWAVYPAGGFQAAAISSTVRPAALPLWTSLTYPRTN